MTIKGCHLKYLIHFSNYHLTKGVLRAFLILSLFFFINELSGQEEQEETQDQETPAIEEVEDAPQDLPAAAAEGSGEIVGNPDNGKDLFKTHCASCHNKNMVDDLTGPALGGVEDRWSVYPREDLFAWTRNSQSLIAAGHPRAKEMWDEWKPTVMTPFPDLTDQELEDIYAYINGVYLGTYGVAQEGAVAEVIEEDADSTLIYWVLIGVLLILALILARIIAVLSRMLKARETAEQPEPLHIKDILTNKKLIGIVVFAIIVVGGYTTVNNAIALNRQQGYQPEQPIKFSHEVHAGVNQIDCQFCHDGARRSKHAVIPAANTCMNCHRAIKTGTQTGTAEITKIFASIGYDPNTDTYIKDYEEMSEENIALIYKAWIGENFKKESGVEELSEAAEEEVNERWEYIVESLTHENKSSVAGPIEWVRVHNLPDHAYFNHAQHVKVGQVDCQICHGEVEKMEVLEQYAPLSMGWCVNCHRETEVEGFKDGNNYYLKNYEKLHEAFVSGDKEQISVEDIGGLECQKCHY